MKNQKKLEDRQLRKKIREKQKLVDDLQHQILKLKEKQESMQDAIVSDEDSYKLK